MKNLESRINTNITFKKFSKFMIKKKRKQKNLSNKKMHNIVITSMNQKLIL